MLQVREVEFDESSEGVLPLAMSQERLVPVREHTMGHRINPNPWCSIA
jgi:hypothetical protein